MEQKKRKSPVGLTLQQRGEIIFGVAPMDALMKLEISMIDAKIDGIYRRESALPECEWLSLWWFVFGVEGFLFLFSGKLRLI